jgi:hypothetical protein
VIEAEKVFHERVLGAPQLVAIEGIRAVRVELDRAELAALNAAREQGYTWAEIGEHLRLTPQAAQQRHARLAASVR